MKARVQDVVEVGVEAGAIVIRVDSQKLPPGHSVEVGTAAQTVRVEPKQPTEE